MLAVAIGGLDYGRVEDRRNARHFRRRRRNPAGEVLIRDGQGRLAGEGRLAGQQLVDHHPQRVEVRTGVGRLAVDLFGRQVLDGARHRAFGLADVGVGEGVSQSEVGNLHRAIRGDQDVLGLDVAVDDAVAVGMVQGCQHLEGDLGHLGRLQPAVLQQHRPEVRPPDELHDHEIRAVGGAPVVHVDDVGVVQHGGGPGLPAEAIDEAPVAGELLMQHLEGHFSRQHSVVSAVDLTHAAGGDAGDDLVSAVDGGFGDCQLCAFPGRRDSRPILGRGSACPRDVPIIENDSRTGELGHPG